MSDVKFIDHSDETKARLEEAIEAALEAMSNQAVSYAKQNLTEAGRVDTGALRNSISSEVDGQTAYVGTSMEYAIYNEYGTGVYAEGGSGRKSPWAYQDSKGEWHRTRGITPTHFLKRAAEEHKDEYTRIATSIIKSHMN